MEINFFETIDDALLKFAVIISKHNEKWVLCKHKERNTFEFPGGHREVGEQISETAKRELYEETGAIKYSISPICAYSTTKQDKSCATHAATYGMLFFADIQSFESNLHNEMESIHFFECLPTELTYPHIYPILIEKCLKTLNK